MGGKPFVEVENDGSIIKRNSVLGQFRYQGSIPWGMNYLYILTLIAGVQVMVWAVIFSILGNSPANSLVDKAFPLVIIATFLIGVFMYPFTYIKIPNKIKKKL